MKAMIFAAGLGTRLKPLTDTMPKAMVPVSGKPLLRHVLDRLSAAGYDDITVNVHHFASQIVDHIAANEGVSKQSGKGVHVSDETALLLDTGGGILHARRYLEGAGHFLVHNVDILSNLDLKAFEAAVREDSLATLVVSERQTSRYLLFDDQMRLVGWTNVKTGEVRSPFKELDPSACRKLAFSGIHCMSDKVFDLMEKRKAHDGVFPIMDFYLEAAADHTIRGFVPDDLRMVDVGKLDTLAVAESFLVDLSK